MIPSEHSAMGALAASVLTYLWNRKNPNQNLSILVMAVLGAIAARVPDWDITLVEVFGVEGSNFAHRSVYTHSILGIILFSTLLYMVLIATNSIRKKFNHTNFISVKVVTFILTIAFATHILFDALEAYPTPTLYPISDHRFTGWVPGSVYHNTFFLFSTWIVGYGGSIALILSEKNNHNSSPK